MFYLMVFLSLLVGILIYMFDPVPMDSRRTLNVRSAESYVVSFLNQHQAAKDYLKYWLGKVYPGGEADNEVYSVASVFSQEDSSLPSAVVIALPRGLDDFIQPAVSQRFKDGTKSLLHTEGGENDDGYVSALLCLNSDDNLGQCYQYTTVSGGSKRISWQPHARKFVITYGIHHGLTRADEKVHTSNSKARDQELWRQAMATRSHSTTNCGFLLKAPSGQTWSYDRTRLGGERVQAVGLGKYNYCIHNGQRCMSVLEPAIEAYLKAAVHLPQNGDLSDYFFCISEVNDPYHNIATPLYHYDGVDVLAKGAGSDIPQGSLSVPVDGTSLTPILKNLGDDPVMPFKQADTDFTLSFVTDTNNVWLNLDNPPKKQLYTIDASLQFWSGGDYLSLASAGFWAPLKDKRISWTIMRRDNKVFLFINGCHVVNVDSLCWDGTNLGPAEEADDVHFSGNGELIDVRYYNYALSSKQLKQNFKLDQWRYGIPELECESYENMGHSLRNIPSGELTCNVLP